MTELQRGMGVHHRRHSIYLAGICRRSAHRRQRMCRMEDLTRSLAHDAAYSVQPKFLLMLPQRLVCVPAIATTFTLLVLQLHCQIGCPAAPANKCNRDWEQNQRVGGILTTVAIFGLFVAIVVVAVVAPLRPATDCRHSSYAAVTARHCHTIMVGGSTPAPASPHSHRCCHHHHCPCHHRRCCRSHLWRICQWPCRTASPTID